MGHIMQHLIDVDLVIISIAYLLIVYGQRGAGIFAFGQGLLIDILSAGLLGLFTLLYLCVFLSIHFGTRLLDLSSLRGQVTILSLAVFLKEILLTILLDVFSLEMTLSPSVFLAFTLSALCSGLIAPFVFYLFDHLDLILTGGVRGTSEDRL